jgi:hypothetical protein
MPTIASLPMDTMSGELLPSMRPIEDFAQRGVGDQLISLEPWRAVPVGIITEYAITAASVGTIIAGYVSLQGTEVTVVDQYSVTTTSVLVVEVQPQRAQALGDGRWLILCRWTLLPQVSAP